MGWVFLVLGAVIGAATMAFGGLLFGGVLGYLFGQVLEQGRRLQRAERLIAQLEERLLHREEESIVAPAPTVAQHAEPVAPSTETMPEPLPEIELSAWEGDKHDEWSPSPANKAALPAIAPLIESLRHLLFDGNMVVRVGIVVLFFGVAFMLKYAVDHALFPIELRLAASALGAIAMIGIGWRLRLRRAGYALLVQGGGIGIFYITVFAAAKLYHLLPLGLSFALMLAVVVLSAVLALLQDSRSLAAFGISGGFLAPILTSTGGGSHVMLFSYYALLNGGILAIAWFRAWRELNLLGFLFTFVIGAFWGFNYYRPEHFATTEPFLILFTLFYVAIAVLFALRQPLKLRGYVDGSLVFGVPLVAFSLQYGLVRKMEYGLAWSALGLAAIYIVLATVLWQRHREWLRMVSESFLALGVAFATLTIPLALDNRWTSAAWALEGAALLWVGVRQGRLLPRVTGLLLQLAAGGSFLLVLGASSGAWPVLNGLYLGTLLLALAGLFSGWWLYRHREVLRREERDVNYVAMGWGLVWWFLGGIREVERFLDRVDQYPALLLFFAASFAALLALFVRLEWRALRYPFMALLPAVVLLLMSALDSTRLGHSFANWALLAWLAVLAVQYRILWQLRLDYAPALRRFGHAATLWLVCFLLTDEAYWQVGHSLEWTGGWALATLGLVPALLLALLFQYGMHLRWPVRRELTTYFGPALIPVALYLFLWQVMVSASAGSAEPLPYLPLINPLELVQVLVLLLLASWLWLHRGRPARITGGAPLTVPWLALGIAAFILLNEVVAHTIHHWYDVPYHLGALHRSQLFQATLSVVWTVTALLLAVTATRRGWRLPWFAGALLLALVVVKLFFVDLAGSGTIARIVSFLAVGSLMLVIGYLSPLPPRQKEPENE